MVVWRCGLESGLGGGLGGGSGRPYVAIPGFGGGLGGVPCDDDDDEGEAKRSEDRNKEARALDQQVGMRIKTSKLYGKYA